MWLQTLLSYGKHPETQVLVIPPGAITTAASGVTVGAPFPPHPEVSVAVYGAGQYLYSYQGHNVRAFCASSAAISIAKMKCFPKQIVEHSGGSPGWVTLISRAPQDGLGVAVFTNWDGGGLVMDLIMYYLYEKALGLPHVDWSSRCVVKDISY